MGISSVSNNSSGSSVTEVAGYSNFAAGTDGDLGKDTDSGKYYVYNETLALWMPPDVQPTSLLEDYTASALPDSGNWTKEGTEGAAVAGGILTITDDGGSYAAYEFTDGTNLVAGNNSGVVMRARLTAQSATVNQGYRCMLALKAGANGVGALGLACDTALSGTGSVAPMYTSSGGRIYIPGASPDNNVYQVYYLFWDATSESYRAGALGSYQHEIGEDEYTTNYITNSSAFFGTYDSGDTCTMLVDYVKVFNW